MGLAYCRNQAGQGLGETETQSTVKWGGKMGLKDEIWGETELRAFEGWYRKLV